MDSIEDIAWDVVIAGTGLQQSLLALSSLKVLHVDNNNYYGGTEAALNIKEAELWLSTRAARAPYNDAAHVTRYPATANENGKMRDSRSYNLTWSPQIIYARSHLPSVLVSAKVDAQLDFLAVGAWYIYTLDSDKAAPSLVPIPSGREEILADSTLSRAAKQSLIKFLRFMREYEEHRDDWQDYAVQPFTSFLDARFKFDATVRSTIEALTLSIDTAAKTTTEYALARIATHLKSTGVFGTGFSAVIPKWGGLAEVAQVGCRAGAVGGGVYVLNDGIAKIDKEDGSRIRITLANGESISTQWLAGGHDEPSLEAASIEDNVWVTRSINVVSSPLSFLFQPIEGGPTPAVAVVAIPIAQLIVEVDESLASFVYIMAHSSDTGECPQGQCSAARAVVAKALDAFLQSTGVERESIPRVLWQIEYQQAGSSTASSRPSVTVDNCTIKFPTFPVDLAFDDGVIARVRQAWEAMSASDGQDFLTFESREGLETSDDEVG